MSAGGIVRITPGRAVGRVTAPPSKSMAHRWLIGSALAGGESLIRHSNGLSDVLIRESVVDKVVVMGGEEYAALYALGDPFLMEHQTGIIRKTQIEQAGHTGNMEIKTVLLAGSNQSVA